MVVRWSDIAEDVLKGIFDYYLAIAGRRIAWKIIDGIRYSVDSLATIPNMAPVELLLEDRAESYRSLIVGRTFKIVYRIEEQTIYIVDIWDCRRDPDKLRKGVMEQKKKCKRF